MRDFVLAAVAMTGLTGAQEKPPIMATSFYCFQYAPGLKDVFVRTGAEAYQKIELSTANIIGPVPVVAVDGTVTISFIEPGNTQQHMPAWDRQERSASARGLKPGMASRRARWRSIRRVCASVGFGADSSAWM